MPQRSIDLGEGRSRKPERRHEKPEKQPDTRGSHIQFRPGPFLEVWIAEYARSWGLTESEVVKRLAALAACSMDVSMYSVVKKLAECSAIMTQPDFVAACAQIRTAVDSANRTRADLKRNVMTTEERLAFVKRIVNEAEIAKAARNQREEQHEHLREA